MISVVRLKDGTEIVGDVIDVNNESIIITDPLQINYKITIMQPAPSMGLSRFMPFSDGTDFEIPVATIAVMMKARDSLAAYYVHALSTYITDLDSRIDHELNTSAKSSNTEIKTTNELYTQLLEKLSFEDTTLQ